MKKTLLLTALLIGAFVQAQDYTFIAKSKTIENQESAVALAKEMASFANKDLRFYKAKDFGDLHKLKVVFVPNTLKDIDIENDAVSEADQAAYLSFVFNIDMVGENKDLEKPGIKQYRLIETESKYLTVFPIWQKYFKRTAELEKTLEDYKSQRLIEPDKNIRYLFQDQNGSWIIRG